MTEPASSAAAAVVAGAGATALASLGIEPAPLFWAVAGASVGVSFATEASRMRAAAVFVAVSLCCSVFGSWLAVRYYGGEHASRNAFSAALGVLFHPLLNAAVTRIPLMLDGALKKIGIGGQA